MRMPMGIDHVRKGATRPACIYSARHWHRLLCAEEPSEVFYAAATSDLSPLLHDGEHDRGAKREHGASHDERREAKEKALLLAIATNFFVGLP